MISRIRYSCRPAAAVAWITSSTNKRTPAFATTSQRCRTFANGGARQKPKKNVVALHSSNNRRPNKRQDENNDTKQYNKNLKKEQEDDESTSHLFSPGEEVLVEVISFGPLGASVDVLAKGHDHEDIDSITEPLGKGLIIQKEIHYFRQGRNNLDVVRGEILPGYVERVREELDGRLDIGLRAYGGKAKAEQASTVILNALQDSEGGVLMVGDKSTPEQIAQFFPGISKGAFKKAVAALYKQGMVQPGPDSIRLMAE